MRGGSVREAGTGGAVEARARSVLRMTHAPPGTVSRTGQPAGMSAASRRGGHSHGTHEGETGAFQLPNGQGRVVDSLEILLADEKVAFWARDEEHLQSSHFVIAAGAEAVSVLILGIAPSEGEAAGVRAVVVSLEVGFGAIVEAVPSSVDGEGAVVGAGEVAGSKGDVLKVADFGRFWEGF